MNQTGIVWTPDQSRTGMTKQKLAFLSIGVCFQCPVWARNGFGLSGMMEVRILYSFLNRKLNFELAGEVTEYLNNYFPADFTYQEFAKDFQAEFFNPTEWAELFAKSGAKYVSVRISSRYFLKYFR